MSIWRMQYLLFKNLKMFSLDFRLNCTKHKSDLREWKMLASKPFVFYEQFHHNQMGNFPIFVLHFLYSALFGLSIVDFVGNGIISFSQETLYPNILFETLLLFQLFISFWFDNTMHTHTIWKIIYCRRQKVECRFLFVAYKFAFSLWVIYPSRIPNKCVECTQNKIRELSASIFRYT